MSDRIATHAVRDGVIETATETVRTVSFSQTVTIKAANAPGRFALMIRPTDGGLGGARIELNREQLLTLLLQSTDVLIACRTARRLWAVLAMIRSALQTLLAAIGDEQLAWPRRNDDFSREARDVGRPAQGPAPEASDISAPLLDPHGGPAPSPRPGDGAVPAEVPLQAPRDGHDAQR